MAPTTARMDKKKKTTIIYWSAPMATGERLDIEIKHQAAMLLHID
jgi:5-formaminoimidazole-4-carboxamide-1-beta-D-ribofuranosyl 5'-monophosphate synthetase